MLLTETSPWLQKLLTQLIKSTISEFQESGNTIQLVLRSLGWPSLLLDGSRVFLTDIINSMDGSTRKDHHHSGSQVSSTHKVSSHPWNKRLPDKEKLRAGLLMRSSTLPRSWRISSKVTMEESKERLLMLQMRVFISMVFTLKDLAGTDQRRDLKNPTLRSSTINSQFSMFPLSQQLSHLVVLQELVKPQDKRLSKLRKLFTHAQFTNTQWETTDTLSSELESKPNKPVLHKDQTKVWPLPWNGNSVVSASSALRIEHFEL